ncbi:DUF2590 family protein [Methylomagnum ishizawai]|uniref:DUF2590 family protein n=1 Tax=Methylomagnum ishizawai TaxID=1760988 RepID=UPI001C332DE0|nr:DUF2590 family protein [Methylomagnum ishizawai]BBL73964.1 hypothetical protein MishRS11D_10620 [Methylomagnum ishizawai]
MVINDPAINEHESDGQPGPSAQPYLGNPGLYIDWRIVNNDLDIDLSFEPLLLANKDSVVQDLKHVIRESGLLWRCIAERDGVKVRALLDRLVLLIEEDIRLVPGTVKIERADNDTFFILGDTVDYGKFGFTASILPGLL